jgi:hypothetical protein
MDHLIWQSLDRLAVIIGRLDVKGGVPKQRVHRFPIDVTDRLIGFVSERESLNGWRFFTLYEHGELSRVDNVVFDASSDDEIQLNSNNTVQIMRRPVFPDVYYCIPIDRVLACMKADSRLYAANGWKSYLFDGVFGLETLQRLYALMKRRAFSNTLVETNEDCDYSDLETFGYDEPEGTRAASQRIAAETKTWLQGTNSHSHPRL